MEQPWERKRRISNYIGFFALTVIVGGVLVLNGINWVQKSSKISSTKKTLAELCKGFTKNDKAVIGKWARGEYVDSWNNHIVLEAADRTNSKVVFVSKGPDGQLGTPDDIRSEECKPSSRAEAQKAINVDLVEAQQKVEEAIEGVKQATEKGEAQGERGGWKWRIRWGKPAEKNDQKE